MGAKQTLLPAVAAILALLSVSIAPPSQASHDLPEPPSSDECTELNDGEVLTLAPMTPECVLVEPGERVRWTNPVLTTHDPGDGVLGDETAECFEASDYTLGQGIDTGESFSVEFHFEDGTLQIANDTFDGEPTIVPDRTCSDREWTRNEDGDVALRYICHVHETRDVGRGWIIVDTN